MRKTSISVAAPKCTVCDKFVYDMEKVTAIGQIWHKTCFTCGGKGTDGGCKRVLTLDKYVDHGTDPFCKTCHAKHFGPKGYGYGVGAGVLSCHEERPSSSATVAPVVLPSAESSKEYDEGMMLSARSDRPPPPPLPSSNSKKQKSDDSSLAVVTETEVEMNISSAADDESLRDVSLDMAMSPAPIASPRAEPMETVTEGDNEGVTDEDMTDTTNLEEAARAALLAKSTKQPPVELEEQDLTDSTPIVSAKVWSNKEQQEEEVVVADEEMVNDAEPSPELSIPVLVESSKAPASRPPPPPPPAMPVSAVVTAHVEEEIITEEEVVAEVGEAVTHPTAVVDEPQAAAPMVEVEEAPLPPPAPVAVVAPTPAVPIKPATSEISPRIPSPDRFITSNRAPSPARSKSPARDAAEIVGVTKKPVAVSKFGGGAPKCSVCQKAVYPAEKVQAIDQIWHKTCFCCGGNSQDGGCKKVLTLDKYVSHGNDPFCKPCHGKIFGPKGYGYGTGAAVLSSYEQKK